MKYRHCSEANSLPGGEVTFKETESELDSAVFLRIFN
jgi:hypothetical protein